MELTSTPRSPPGQLRQNFHNFTTFDKNEKNELELTSELRSAPTKVCTLELTSTPRRVQVSSSRISSIFKFFEKLKKIKKMSWS